jgi:hypothetical protein
MAALANENGSSLLIGPDAARRCSVTRTTTRSPRGRTRTARAVVRQASPRALRRVLSGARGRARLAATDEPAVLRLRARRANPAPLRAAGESLAPTICYEDAYGSEQLRVVRQSSLLVNVTNDAWFGDSTAPHQHLDISRMRSLESGRADAARHERRRDRPDRLRRPAARDAAAVQPGVLTGAVQPRAGLTPYVRFGNWPVLGVLWVAVALIAGLHRRGLRR